MNDNKSEKSKLSKDKRFKKSIPYLNLKGEEIHHSSQIHTHAHKYKYIHSYIAKYSDLFKSTPFYRCYIP